jgi:RNA polymerase sigma-70 factor (ECF subfamily)
MTGIYPASNAECPPAVIILSVSSPAPIPSDADLVTQCLRGDGDAFDALVRRHYRTAFSVALGVLVNRHDAEEVCQDSFVKALERLEDCRDPDRFVPWLMTIVRHRALSYRSYRKVRETSELMPEIAEARDSPFRDLAQAELGDRLTAALATLSEVQRNVVLLHDLDGWSHKEIAEELEMTEVRSRQHLFVARKALRERLGGSLLREYTSND